MKRSVLITLGIFALVVMVGCQPAEKSTSEVAAEPAAPQAVVSDNASDLPLMGAAPAWTLTRLDGTTLSSADLAGKVVVIDFWATWCPPCREEIPGYIAMQEAMRDDGVVIVGISLDQGGADMVRDFAQKWEMNYDVVMGDEAVAEAFGGIRAIPTTFLIDRQGQVRHRKQGMMHREDYEPLVRSLL